MRSAASRGRPFWPCIGRGADQQRRQWYNRPTATGSVVKIVGQGFHVNRLATEKLYLVKIDCDHWKTWLHQRLAAPLEKPGAMTFHKAGADEHLSLAKHLTAEVKTEEFVAGCGVVVKWERVRRQNHWLDALCYASAAGYLSGVRLLDEERPRPPATPAKPKPRRVFRRANGEPWIDIEAWRSRRRQYWG